MLQLKLILISLCLMTCAACSTGKPPNTVVEVKLQLVSPPDSMLVAPPKPRLTKVETTDDIVANSDAFEEAYLKAAQQIKSLREWVVAQKARLEQVP